MIFDIDDIIPFSQRHKGETIRQIIRYDSGYLRDLFLKDSRVSFSKDCFAELCRLTRGHYDNWEKPKKESNYIFSQFKTYKSPYLFDFNTGELEDINNKRINS